MLLSLFSWFGINYMFDTGLTERLNEVIDNAYGWEKLISLGICYSIFMAIFVYQYMVNKCPYGCLSVFWISELVYFIAFITLIVVWHVIWDSYDYIIDTYADENDLIKIHVSIHVCAYVVVYFSHVGTALNGPRGVNPGEPTEAYKSINRHQSVKDYLKQYEHLTFFDIAFVSKKQKDLNAARTRGNIVVSDEQASESLASYDDINYSQETLTESFRF